MLEQITNFVAGAEWMWILVVVVVLIFGAKKIPALARSIGQAKGELKKGELEAEKDLKEFKEKQDSN